MRCSGCYQDDSGSKQAAELEPMDLVTDSASRASGASDKIDVIETKQLIEKGKNKIDDQSIEDAVMLPAVGQTFPDFQDTVRPAQPYYPDRRVIIRMSLKWYC